MTDYDAFKGMLQGAGVRFTERCFTPKYQLISYEVQGGPFGGGPYLVLAIFTEAGVFGGFTSDD